MKPHSITPDGNHNSPLRCRGNVVLLILVAVVAIGLGAFVFQKFAGDSADDTSAELATLQETLKTSLALPLDFRKVDSFELLDKHAEPVTETVFDNRWSLVFFGYTHCPDVCPITLQVMKNVIAKLEELGEPEPQIVFVSVDPVRDTSDVLNNYIAYFNDEFMGITGDQTQMHNFTRSLGIVASFTANEEDPDNYIVDHTASLLLIDPQRRVRAKVTPPHEAQTIVEDYLAIVAAPS